MIVRISGEGQYRLSDSDAERLGELENGVVSIVEGGREDGFADAFGALLDYVRAQGTPLGDDELEGSNVILPPSDISFEEASREFTGEGLIPD
jgi:23S rRNA A2030 N6-methylase RlmJ